MQSSRNLYVSWPNGPWEPLQWPFPSPDLVEKAKYVFEVLDHDQSGNPLFPSVVSDMGSMLNVLRVAHGQSAFNAFLVKNPHDFVLAMKAYDAFFGQPLHMNYRSPDTCLLLYLGHVPDHLSTVSKIMDNYRALKAWGQQLCDFTLKPTLKAIMQSIPDPALQLSAYKAMMTWQAHGSWVHDLSPGVRTHNYNDESSESEPSEDAGKGLAKGSGKSSGKGNGSSSSGLVLGTVRSPGS